jgi:hypothetical protein
MEQRWFVGAHGNVGGGYKTDGLFHRPLQWLQQEAKSCGLTFRQVIPSIGNAFYESRLRNPLTEIGYGAYKLTQWFKPHHRQVTLGDNSKQMLDYTVLERWIWHPQYSPKSLEQYLPTKPRQKPSSMRMPDEYIQELLNDPSAKVSPSRGYMLSAK